MRRLVQLVDDRDYLWVEASVTPTRLVALLKAYAKCGILLHERGE